MKKLFFILLSAALVSTCLLCGCDRNISGSESAGNVQSDNKDGIDYSVVYYSVDDNKRVIVEEKFTGSPEFMISHLLSRISDLCGIAIDFNSITDNGDGKTITIDFSQGGSPVSGLSSSSESAVLDSITETIFANYPHIDNVCFTCNEKEYNSGHVFLEKGEAYRTRVKEEIPEETVGLQ